MSYSEITLMPNASREESQSVIRAVYRYVLGNPHMMESERLTVAESQLSEGSISVREFVRAVGKSEIYRERHFQSCAPYRFVELNYQHFLGRQPQSQAEISEHIVRCVSEGYGAEIDSYVDSDEYLDNFGENTVPYNRGTRTEVGISQITYNRSFAVDRGPAQVSSAVKSSQMVSVVPANAPSVIKASKATVTGSGTEKRFKILVTGSKFDSPRRRSTSEYIVNANKMTPQIQRINRTSGKIVSITEIV
ncbi:MAG: photosystem I reaction center subunit XII [Coleofasciculaceae cyanobacterium RL_1_1]|nr:photosystem I reaction center subunit XII [Coleofasciculaceae cyanobacterium RL_1_1]